MSADLSRVRFDPLRDHSGVGSLQGRLWLDADFNEQVAITDRRLRAQVVDLAPAPTVVSRQTPQAFEITLANSKLSIGAGRMYVDGLLAENHGAKQIFDPVLAEPNRSGPILYQDQPYLPSNPVGDLPQNGLVYLDVWERELTHLNTPDLVEQAIGVETTTRTQTAWQVRILPDIGAGMTCDSPLPQWDELIAPSSARLTTGTVDVDPIDDPCEVPPGKGYRGAENQLYRVELHSPTHFKWSRDNATVASVVAKILSGTKLELASLGRDEMLGIKSTDWVEITDDNRELSHQAGEMRQVTVEAGSVISFSPALPSDLASSTAGLRVRKWDSKLVEIPANGSAVVLEHGLTVAFSFVNSGAPRPGDYWVFAARVADASVETLTAAPPRGIHHHYAKLALISLPGTVSDCRPDWPVATVDGCGCEICVTPESHESGDLTIQEAVNMLQKSGGGMLTLCPGTYHLEAPVALKGARSIRVRGAGRASALVAPNGAFVVSRCQDVALEGLSVISASDSPAVLLGDANRTCRLEELWINQEKGLAIGLSGVQQSLTIRNCKIESVVGVGVLSARAAASIAAFSDKEAGLLTFGLSIQDNLMFCAVRGIDFGLDRGAVIQHTGLTRISGNTVTACSDAGMVLTGLIPDEFAGVDSPLEICGNLLEVRGSGIVTGGRARISDNTVIAARRLEDKHGIVLEASPPSTPDNVAHVLANKVNGFGGYGIVVSAQMLSLIVKQNIVRGTNGGILVQTTTSGGNAAVDNNQILHLRPLTESAPTEAGPIGLIALARPTFMSAFLAADVASSRSASAHVAASPAAGSDIAVPRIAGDEPTVFLGRGPGSLLSSRAVGFFGRSSVMIGIGVIGAANAAVAGNTVDGIAAEEQDGGQTRHLFGILVYTCVDARISGNAVSGIGNPGTSAGNATGILCGAWQETANIADNVVHGGAAPRRVVRQGWTALTVQGGRSHRVGPMRSVTTAAGAMTFAGSFAYLQPALAAHVELHGNSLQGGADDVAVTVSTIGDVVMSANRCVQPGKGDRHVVRMTAATAVVQGNRLQGGRPSMSLTCGEGAAAVFGNITSGGIEVNQTMADPMLNPIA